MAVLSDYTSGTITLANGSTAVTGTGTLFQVTRFREGDTLQIQNLTAVIASVNSDTSLTLTAPWTGTSIVNGAYRARQLGDVSRYPTQAATLIDLLGNGVLSNLAELGVENGKAPVGNAAGEYELQPIPTDPNGNLAKLAALVLAANKIFRTDASGTPSLGEITNAAAALLALDGAANKLPYFSGASTAALADLTAAGRAGINTTGTPTANQLQYLTSGTASALTPITAFARTVLDDADAGTMWGTLDGNARIPLVNAGLAAGAVGTYGLMRWVGSTVESPGQTTSGANLRFTNGAGGEWAAATGSWRLMSGAAGNSTDQARVSLWLRYA
jgi:hypothetical protein